MPANLIVSRSTTLFQDNDEIGVFDAGDILYTRLTITNNGDVNATNVTFQDTFKGTTLVNGTLNISPIAFNDTFQAIGNTVLRVGTVNTIGDGESTFFAGNLLSNDISITADQVTGFQIDAVTDGVSVNGGKFNIFGDGTFNYVNDGTDATLTTDSFTYSIRDKGLDGNYNTADDLTSTATVTITFAQQTPGGPAHRVWYVDGSAAAGGDGTSARPFQDLSQLNGANGAGDRDAAGEYIYVENTVSGPIGLEAGQQLIGDGAALIVNGVTLATAGTNSVLTGVAGQVTVTLSTGNTIAGIDIGSGTGTGNGISGLNFGTLTVNNATINAAGQALSLTNGTVAGTGFTSTSSDGGANNVLLSNVAGTVALGTGALSGATAGGFVVIGGSVSTTYAGSLTHSAAGQNVIRVSGGHAETGAAGTGTLAFTGTVNGGTGTGIAFDNADGIYNFTGALTLTNGTSGIALANGSDGDFTFSNANNNISRNTSGGPAFSMFASNANVAYTGSIGSHFFKAVHIDNHDSGTVTFSGDGSIYGNGPGAGITVTNSNGGTINFNTAVSFSTGVQTAIELTNNSGSATNFNPNGTGLDISTTSGTGFIANNAGTITILDNGSGNTINVTAGSGATVAFSATGGTTFGAGGVTFDSISQSGGANAIVLNGTGTAGGFNILGNGLTGTAGEGTGGTIQNTTGDAISLSNTAGVKLNDMIIGANAVTAGEGQPDTVVNIGDDGISMTNVTALVGQNYGLVLDNVTISRTGGHGINGTGGGNVGLKVVDSRLLNIGNDLAGTVESAMDFGTGFATNSDQLVGTVYIDRTTFAGFTGYGFTVENAGNGTLNMTVDNSVFKNNDATGIGDSGIQIIADGSQSANNPKVNLLIEDTTFTNIDLDGIEIFADPGSTFNATIRRTTHSSPNGDNAIHVASGSRDSDDTESMTVLLQDNNVSAMRGSLIFLKSGAGNFDATITGGTLDSGNTTNGAAGHIGRGIELLVDSDHDPSLGITGDQTHTKLRIDNVAIRNIGVDGIHVGMNEIASGSTIDVSITNSSIGSATAPVGRQDTGEGIEIIAHDAAMNLLISGNTIFTRGISGTSEAIDVDSQTQHFTATVNATITNNRLNNINLGGAPAANNLDVNAESAASTVRLDMSGNFSDNGPIDADYQLANSGGTFIVKGAGTGAVTAASIQATQASGTASVSGTITYNNNAPITLPTGPATPTLPGAPPANLSAEAPAPDVVTEEKAADTPKADNGDSGASDAPAPASSTPIVIDDGILSQAELGLIVEAAIGRWIAAGATEEQVAAMRAVNVSVSDLGGLTLGESGVGTITLDSDAAGWRWFVDATPDDDSEYAGSGTQLAAVDKMGLAGTRIDLLTVVTHELGHQIGLSDTYAPGETDALMYGTIGAGERRLPGGDDLVHAAGAPVTGAFAFAPISLGTIEPSRVVVVEWRHTVDAPGEDRLAGYWSGQSIVAYDGGTTVLSNSEGGVSGLIDSVSFGNLVYLDVNKNGLFDGSDTGIAGVTMSLFADTNNSGHYDSGDLAVVFDDNNGNGTYDAGIDDPLAPGTGSSAGVVAVQLTATTNASGLYSFAGLAPGDYLAVFNASNFAPGGALHGKVVTAGGTDPDDTNADGDGSVVAPGDVNVDGDNNAETTALGTATRAVRLDYGMEPGGDVNNTVDAAFVQPNQAPVIANLNGNNVAYAENAARVRLDLGADVTVTDTDSPNFDTGSLTVSFVIQTGDRLILANEGGFTTAPNGTVSYNDGVTTVAIGTVAEYSAAGGQFGFQVTFNANATPAIVQQLMRVVYYDSTSENPAGGARTVTWTLVDGDGRANGGDDDVSVTSTVTVTAVNDAPAGTDNTGTLTMAEDSRLVLTQANFGFSDTDGNAFAGVVVTTVPGAGTLYIDTDGAGGTLGTAVGAGQFVAAGAITSGQLVYVPNANASGDDTFTFQVRDNGGTANGGVDTDASANTIGITVTAVNDAPVNTVGAAVTINEDAGATALTGISVSDVEASAAGTGVYVTFEVDHGVIALRLDVPGGITGEDIIAEAPNIITVFATIAKINATLAATNGLTYTVNANYNGADELRVSTNDDGSAGVDPGTTADGQTEEDVDAKAITVTAVNDAPAGTDKTVSTSEDDSYTFVASDFGFTDVLDDNAFAGVVITTLATDGVIKLDGTAVTTGQFVNAADIAAGKLTFAPDADAFASPYATFTFQVRDDGGTGNGGVNTDQSANTMTINVTPDNLAPVVDLNGANGDGTGFASTYVEGGAAAIGDSDLTITDPDSGDDIVSATITITNPVSGDKLNVGALPGTVSVDPSSTASVVKLIAAPGTSAADFETAIKSILFDSSSDDPTAGGTNLSRSITVTVNDGTIDSAAATATVTVIGTNDSPDGTSGNLAATEDAFRLLTAADFGFTDPDSADTMSAVTITAVNGSGQLYYDADGTAGSGAPVAVTSFPQTYTVAELADGRLSFKADADANGDGTATIDFTVVDSSGAGSAVDPVANTLTVDVAPVNDAPVLSAPTNATVTFTENDVSVPLMQGVTLSDVDFPGNYRGGGLTLSVSGGPGSGGVNLRSGSSFKINSNGDGTFSLAYEIVNGDGSRVQLAFGTIAGYGTPTVTITDLSGQATDARLEDLFDDFVYVIVGDNPAAGDRTVTLTFDDGGNIGGGALTATRTQTLSVIAVNDAPTLDLNGATAGTGTEAEYTEQAAPVTLAAGLTIADPDDSDIEGATLTITAGLQAGLDVLTIDGATSGDSDGISWSYNGQTGVLTLTGSATVAAYEALLRQAGFESTSDAPGESRTITWKVNDGTADSNLPTTTIAITATPDAAIAKPDDVTTAENQVLSGDLFADNGNGIDRDPDGEAVTIALVNGQAANVGSTITLASGAKLTVRADGTFSYDPNGKFNYLVSPSKAAAAGTDNDSATETFTYTLTDGNEVTVTVDVTGVDGAGDQLRGDAGDNTITGTAQGDLFVLDQGGDDTVYGLAGNDFFYFGGALTGADTVEGGNGSDTIGLVGTYDSLVFTETSLNSVERLALYTTGGGAGSTPASYDITMHDANVASGGTLFIIAAGLGADETLNFNGTAETDGAFNIRSGAGDDVLAGGAMADRLNGGAGDDQLFGRGGNDTLIGGLGADTLRGGGGKDIFRFESAEDSGTGEDQQDIIVDFQRGFDKIDLSAIDADKTTEGNQEFTFVGDAAFSSKAGELRSSVVGEGQWLVEGDIDGDGVGDFAILVSVNSAQPLTVTDFLL